MGVTRLDFDEETYRTLERAAAGRGLTVPELLRAMAADLARVSPAGPGSSADLLSFVGRGNSGLGDLAERHDDYLAGGER